MGDDYRDLVKQTILDEDAFVRAVFSGRRRGHFVPWRQVVIRPVLIQGDRHLQFSYRDDTKDITKNYTGQAEALLDELLAQPFSSIDVRTAETAVQVQITRKGQAIVHRRKDAASGEKPSLEHDRHKKLMLPADRPDPFLIATGIMTRQGRVRARMRDKFRQINEFLKLVIETGEWNAHDRPLTIVDCGCGRAYLTFAVHYYLNHVLGVPTQVIGLDINAEPIERQKEQVRALGWEGLTFRVSPIIDFVPAEPPDIVLSLHACDTATDEALAQAVRWQSRMIFAVPCCHHHLQQQMKRDTAPTAFHPVLRHGILRERLGDVLTDALRAQILRILGYRTDVVEFVSTEHTPKNLMIRAVRSASPGEGAFIKEYEGLTALWQVKPYLAELLQAELSAIR